ncbi:ankyrin repeat domain-containing protein [Nonomuraea typhae]|uniref:ankyrin repeat domain-containing protein n=1 Tax=Nonomuraea typhae TaxID=2603600 RepID=UPI0012FC9243|nr:ankyrin repeat domain-containing protein [Nonomuraea typhae]
MRDDDQIPGETARDGDAALYQAAVQGRAGVVRMLVDAGADPDHESGEGLPLCAAASWGHAETVQALLDAGADPDRREDAGRSAMAALHWAASGEHLAVVRALLANGADPDAIDAAGRTALSHAAGRGAPAVVKVLLEHGADPAAADARGLRPVDLAREYAGRDLEAELLAQAGEHAPEGSRVTVRRERSEGGDERLVAEVYGPDGRLRSERPLGTGHAEVVRLLEDPQPTAN